MDEKKIAIIRALIHCLTQSYDPISFYGNSMERTDEIACHIWVPA